MNEICNQWLERLGWRAVLLWGALMAVTLRAEATLPQTPSVLFRGTNLWTLHFRFTAEQWAAMEPKGGPGGPFGRPGEFGPPRGAGGPGDFGPGMFIAPALLRRGDLDHDGRLSKAEFESLAANWFTDWDKTKSGKLSLEQVRDGLNSGLGDSDGPSRPAGRRPGMNLQGPEGKRNGLASAMGIEFQYVHADLEFEGQQFKDVAVRYKGNGTFLESRGSLKRSFKVALNKYAKGQELAGVTVLNLHNNVTDPSWMNEVLAYRLYRDAGVPAPRTAYARVYVTVPGQYDRKYLGLYSLVENVDKHFAEANFGTRPGPLFKPVTPELFADLGTNWADYKQTYDPKTEIASRDSQRVMDFCRFVTKTDDAQFSAKLGEFINLGNFARFMAVMVFLSDLDGILGPGQNLYLYLPSKAREFVFIPWDQDHSFGQFARGTQEEREQMSIHHPWQGENQFLERVFKVEAFKKLYLARLEEFSNTIFKPERLAQQVDEVGAAIRPGVEEESNEKLARFDKVVNGEVLTRGPSEGGFGPPGFFQPLPPIKPFVKTRYASVTDQLAGKSEGRVMGEFGFGPPGKHGPGEPPHGFGPGMFLAGVCMRDLDSNHDGLLTREEFMAGFARWFQAWNTDQSGVLTEEQLRAGINKDLDPMRGGMPGGPGFGPPGGPPFAE